MLSFFNSEIIGLLLFGGLGALVKETLDDNALQVPRFADGKFYLGFIGSIILGAAVGAIVDHSPLTAFFAGFTGFAACASLISERAKKFTIPAENTTTPAETATPTIPEIIKCAAQKFGVDPDLALAVAKCESGLNPKARNVNKTGSVDRGLYQINDFYHKDVSDAQADDPVFAAEWFCKAVKDGHLSWWSASEKCWGSAKKV